MELIANESFLLFQLLGLRLFAFSGAPARAKRSIMGKKIW